MKGEELNAWRKRVDLSIPRAAEVLGVAESTLRGLLYGERTITRRTVMLANAYEALHFPHSPLNAREG